MRNIQQRQRSLALLSTALFIFAWAFWQPYTAQAQWATNGANINNTNSGNVGIGTTNPGVPLHVVGDPSSGIVRIEGASSAATPSFGSQVHLVLFNSNTTANNYANLNFQTTDTSGIRRAGPGIAGVFRARTSSTITGDIALYTVNAGTVAEAMRITGSGNVGIGTTNPIAKLDVAGNLNASGTITGGTINAKYQDVAEWVMSRQKLLAGTVVILDPEKSNQVIASTEAYDTRVAGVISEQPGVLLGEGGEGKVKVATTGRVKVRVDATKGAIKIGDLLVTSEIEGVAMKSEPIVVGGRQIHSPGTLLGKALEPLEKGTGEIFVLLGLQ